MVSYIHTYTYTYTHNMRLLSIFHALRRERGHGVAVLSVVSCTHTHARTHTHTHTHTNTINIHALRKSLAIESTITRAWPFFTPMSTCSPKCVRDNLASITGQGTDCMAVLVLRLAFGYYGLTLTTTVSTWYTKTKQLSTSVPTCQWLKTHGHHRMFKHHMQKEP